MKLSILDIERARGADREHELPFRWQAHHVKEIILSRLKGLDIDGSSKITIEFSSPPDGDDAYSQMLGTSMCHREGFDFRLYESLTGFQKDKYLSDEIFDALIEVAQLAGNETAKDRLSVLKLDILNTHFEQSERIEKISKKSIKNHIAVEIFRILNREVGEGWQYVLSHKERIKTGWINKVPDYLDGHEIYKKSFLNASSFWIIDSFKNVVFEYGIEA